jgi:hypothetical protein
MLAVSEAILIRSFEKRKNPALYRELCRSYDEAFRQGLRDLGYIEGAQYHD